MSKHIMDCINKIDFENNDSDDEYKAHQLKKAEIYKKEQQMEDSLWLKLEKMCHKDMAEMYFGLVGKDNHNFVFCNEKWFKYTENNIVKVLGKANPIHLKKNIGDVLQNYFLKHYTNIM